MTRKPRIPFPLPAFLCIFSFLLTSQLHGQELAQVERKLISLSKAFLGNQSLQEKLEVNKQFTSTLRACLSQNESFNYPFDSLNTVSHLYAADKSFRVFTWQLTDRVNDPIPQTLNYFFGLIQRKWVNAGGREEMVVIPLIEITEIPTDIENRVLDQNSWLGGIYYPARFGPNIPATSIKYIDPSTGKKVKSTAYIVMGWNGYDASSNFKFVDVITPDPTDKNRIIFGANIFFFDLVPKYRAVFRYSDNAPFSLNYGYVKHGLGKLFRKKMIVYDHLSRPSSGRRLGTTFAMGPDGSYDALNFFKRGGYFEWYRNIQIAEKYNSKVTQQLLDKQRERERKSLQSAGIPTGNK